MATILDFLMVQNVVLSGLRPAFMLRATFMKERLLVLFHSHSHKGTLFMSHTHPLYVAVWKITEKWWGWVAEAGTVLSLVKLKASKQNMASLP